VAASLTAKEVDDGAEVDPLLDQVAGPVAAFIGDGGYDQDGVYASVAQRHPEAAVVVPPRTPAVPSETAEPAVGRWKQVIGDKLRAHTDERRATEVEVAVHTLNRMLELGRPNYVRTA